MDDVRMVVVLKKAMAVVKTYKGGGVSCCGNATRLASLSAALLLVSLTIITKTSKPSSSSVKVVHHSQQRSLISRVAGRTQATRQDRAWRAHLGRHKGGKSTAERLGRVCWSEAHIVVCRSRRRPFRSTSWPHNRLRAYQYHLNSLRCFRNNRPRSSSKRRQSSSSMLRKRSRRNISLMHSHPLPPRLARRLQYPDCL